MKKIPILLIVLMMVGVGLLSGCTNQENNYNEDKSTETEPTVTYSYRLTNGSYEDIKAYITIKNEDYEEGVSSSPYHWEFELDNIRYDGYTSYSSTVNIMPNGTQVVIVGYDLNIEFVYLYEYNSAINNALANGRIIYTGPCPYMKII